MRDLTTDRAERIREETGCAWECACQQAEVERGLQPAIGPSGEVLCDLCDEYHEGYVACPYMHDFRRTTDLEEEEIARAAFVRHDERLFG